MPNAASDSFKMLQQVALNAMKSTQPSGIYYGTVTSVDPIKIMLEQTIELGKNQLELSSLVQDIEIPVSFDWKTENETQHTHAIRDTYTGGGSSSPTTHLHDIESDKDKKITLHLGLKKGESVILLRKQGGQVYLVLDRVR